MAPSPDIAFHFPRTKPAKSFRNLNTRRSLVCVLCGLLVLQVCHAQSSDPACDDLHARGIACSTTPNVIGPWMYAAQVTTSWSPNYKHTSASEAIRAGEASILSIYASQTMSCSLKPKGSETSSQGSGRYDYGRFLDVTLVGTYSYDVQCVDTSLGYPTTGVFSRSFTVQAKREVGCETPWTEQNSPVHSTAMCVGLSQPVVRLKELGPEDKDYPRGNRIIEATVTNAANGNAPMGGLTITLDVVTDTTRGGAGRVLSTTYPYQYLPGSSTRAITDSTGKTTATFYWPGSPAPVQRIKGCDLSGQCTGTLDIPLDPSVVIGFFNGVANTRSAAQGSLRRLEAEFGPQYKETPLKYAQFYNQTACDGGFCWEDMAETFEQRSMALNGVFADRWETFWDILAGRHQQDTSLTGRLLNLLGNGSNALLQWLDTTATAVLNQLVNNTLRLMTYFSNSPTAANRADHNTRLWRYADDGNQLLLVAHSQGNLFVNSAYDSLMRFKPEAKARVVHVAPAAPTLRGEHVLADIDLVINALRGTGLSSVPDVNINLPLSKIDPSGHSFEPTYLDKSRAAYARTRGMITSSLDTLTR